MNHAIARRRNFANVYVFVLREIYVGQVDGRECPTVFGGDAVNVNIIRLRGKLGWSQEMLAFEAGLHRTFIAHVERQVRNISLDNIERIAGAFNTPVYMLLMPLAD